MTDTRTRDQENKGWTPVLRGDIYCSPKCGAKCKKAEFDLATERATALCERLGHGWKPRVWENMGWYYSAALDLPDGGQIDIHPTHHWRSRKVTYLCYFNSSVGQVMGVTSATPLETLKTAVDRMQNKVDIYTRDLERVRDATLGL